MQFLPRLICGPKQPRANFKPSLQSTRSRHEYQRGSYSRGNKMKKKVLCMTSAAAIVLLIAVVAIGQGGAKKGPEVSRDPDMEKEALHNLEVARQYFKLRKAYVAVLQRCEEVLAGNPEFSKIDEVLFLAGE